MVNCAFVIGELDSNVINSPNEYDGMLIPHEGHFTPACSIYCSQCGKAIPRLLPQQPNGPDAEKKTVVTENAVIIVFSATKFHAQSNFGKDGISLHEHIILCAKNIVGTDNVASLLNVTRLVDIEEKVKSFLLERNPNAVVFLTLTHGLFLESENIRDIRIAMPKSGKADNYEYVSNMAICVLKHAPQAEALLLITDSCFDIDRAPPKKEKAPLGFRSLQSNALIGHLLTAPLGEGSDGSHTIGFLRLFFDYWEMAHLHQNSSDFLSCYKAARNLFQQVSNALPEDVKQDLNMPQIYNQDFSVKDIDFTVYLKK